MTTLKTIERHCWDAPHAGIFMTRALLRGTRVQRLAPALHLHWHDVHWRLAHVAHLQNTTGLRDGGALRLLLPQVLGFRLVMATLTDAAFALPLWSALQVRNRLRCHAAFEPLLPMDLHARTGPWRVVPRGAEIDVALTVEQAGRCVWEGETTFYYRGKAASAMAAAEASAPPVAPACEGVAAVATWLAQDQGGWAFGRLTGDFNGVHWSDRYARAMGFARAFHHPARVLGQCLAQWQSQCGEVDSAQQALDVWIKGPVPYRATLELRAQARKIAHEPTVLALHHDADARAALVARWWCG